MMKTTKITLILSGLVALASAIASGFGLFWQHGNAPYTYTTLRGQSVEIYGQGLYHYDTLFFGAGFIGQDIVVLFLGVPLLIIAIIKTMRDSAIGPWALMGLLGYFLYVYASMALGAAYNPLFILYILIFSASLFAFILIYVSILHIPDTSIAFLNLPISALVAFMIGSGLITLFVWGAPLVEALISGQPPQHLGSYTTMVTFALDLAIITPATLLSGLWIWKRQFAGIVVAVPLLTLIILLAPQIMISTYVQQAQGVELTTGEMVGPVSGFVVLGLIASWFLTNIFRLIADFPPSTADHV